MYVPQSPSTEPIGSNEGWASPWAVIWQLRSLPIVTFVRPVSDERVADDTAAWAAAGRKSPARISGTARSRCDDLTRRLYLRSSGAGEIAAAGPHDDRLALGEVGDRHGALLHGGERAVAGVRRGPARAAFDPRGVLAHHREASAGLRLQVAHDPPARRVAVGAARATDGEVPAAQRQARGQQALAAGLLAFLREAEDPPAEAAGARLDLAARCHLQPHDAV